MIRIFDIPLRPKKAGTFEELLGFSRSHALVKRGSVSVSCATHHTLPALLNLKGNLNLEKRQSNIEIS